MAGEPALAAVDVIPLRRNRTFQVILAGHIVSVLGDGFHSVALSIWVLQSTGSAKAMASIMALRIIIGILLGAVAGTVADRTDRRRLMWTMDLLRGALVLAIAWLVTVPGAPFWALLLLAAPIMAAGQFRYPAFSASLIHIVGKDNVQQAGSLMQMLNTVAQILGPLLGGVVVAAAGGGAALAVDGGTFLFSAACVLAAGAFPSPSGAGRGEGGFWRDLVAGLDYVRRTPLTFAILILAPAVNFFAGAAMVLLPVLAIKVWRATPVEFGALEAAIPLGFGLGAGAIMAAGRRLRRRGWWVSGAVILIGPLLALLGLVTGPRAALPVSLALGVVLSVANVLVSVAL